MPLQAIRKSRRRNDDFSASSRDTFAAFNAEQTACNTHSSSARSFSENTFWEYSWHASNLAGGSAGYALSATGAYRLPCGGDLRLCAAYVTLARGLSRNASIGSVRYRTNLLRNKAAAPRLSFTAIALPLPPYLPPSYRYMAVGAGLLLWASALLTNVLNETVAWQYYRSFHVLLVCVIRLCPLSSLPPPMTRELSLAALSAILRCSGCGGA